MHITNEICQLEWEETGDFCQPPLSSSFYRNYLLQMSFSTLDEPCAMCDPERRGVHCEAMFVQSVKVEESFKKIFLNFIFQTSPACVSFKLSTCAYKRLGRGGLYEGVAAAAMFVESVVCSQEHQFPEFPCCRKAKQQKTNWRDEGAWNGSREVNLTRRRTNFLSIVATWVLSWRVQSVSHLPGIFSMTLQLSLEERYVQALIYLARAPEDFPEIFGLTPSAFGKWWPHLYVNSGARVGAVSYDTVATGLRV